MIIEVPNENSIVKWKNDEKDEWKVAEISDLIKAYERPQVTVFAENASKEEIEDFKQELESVLERPQDDPMKIVAGKCPIEVGGNCPLKPQGEWKSLGFVHSRGYAWCTCSNCGKTTKIYLDKDNDFCCIADIRNKAVACLFCGADMRKGGAE